MLADLSSASLSLAGGTMLEDGNRLLNGKQQIVEDNPGLA